MSCSSSRLLFKSREQLNTELAELCLKKNLGIATEKDLRDLSHILKVLSPGDRAE